VIRLVKLAPEEYESAFILKPSDLPEDIVEVTVEKVYYRELPITGSSLMCKFKEYEKELPLNKTNKKALVSILESDETDDWLGRKVKLVITPNIRNPRTGQMVESIRVGALKRKLD